MTESAELKPCPFCGHTEIDPCEWMDDKGNQGPGCPECGALADSVATWNRRAPVDAPDGWRTLVKDLADELEEQVGYRYQGYPPNDRRFVRDMLTVKEARAMLAGEPVPANTTAIQAEGGAA